MRAPGSHLDTLDEVSRPGILHSFEEFCERQRLRRLSQLQIVSHGCCALSSCNSTEGPLEICSCVRSLFSRQVLER
jgi:hypothetical protein